MRGMGAQGNELKDLVKDLRPMAVFLQETKCKFENLVKLKGYTPVPISTEPYGIAIYIRSDIPFSSIPLVTPLRAAAVKVTINKTPISICSIHLTDDSDYKLREIDLPELKAQLPGPLLLLGDFNGHNPLWGCVKHNTFLDENEGRRLSNENFSKPFHRVAFGDHKNRSKGLNHHLFRKRTFSSPKIGFRPPKSSN